MNNFAIKSICDLLNTLDRENLKVAYIGYITPIQNWEVVSRYYEYLDIKTPPMNTQDLFQFMRMDVDFYDLEDFYSCDIQYDLVINNTLSGCEFNQVKFFEKLDAITRDFGLILNVVPWATVYEEHFFSYQPAFFKYLSDLYNYNPIDQFFGTVDTKFYSQFAYTKSFNYNKYAKDRMITDLNFPTKAWLKHAWIAAILQKGGVPREEDVQEDD